MAIKKNNVKGNKISVINDSDKMMGKAWFRKRRGLSSPDMGYGWIPITWQGYIAVSLLILVNALSVLYFNLRSGEMGSIWKFLGVLVISLIVFIVLAVKKTKK